MMNFFDKLKRTFIIAEIGVNHNGNMILAKKMIKAAKLCGADAVKFQTFSADKLVSKKTPKVPYQRLNSPKNESHFDMIRKLEFKKKDHISIIRYCKKLKILFISTPYDVESAKFLEKINIKIFKTASADITDLFLHNFLSKTKQPVIISTGMANMNEISEVLKIYKKNKKKNISLLHCVSNYPCKNSSINMRAMELIKSFNYTTGYSDHSSGSAAAILSIALGGKIIEKHFTTNKKLPGPDQKASSDPKEFKKLVSHIREAEIILGKKEKNLQNEERQMHKISRKSVFTKVNIFKKEKITFNKLKLLRPGYGISYKDVRNYIGKTAKINIKANTNLTKNFLKKYAK